jgi:hypothetical protein
MTPSNAAAPHNPAHRRHGSVALLALAICALGLSATARAQQSVDLQTKELHAWLTPTFKLGCVVRSQGIVFVDFGRYREIKLDLSVRDASCKNPAPSSSISGTSYLMLIKQTPSGFDICRTLTAAADGWQPNAGVSKRYDSLPCGAGYYKVMSCSDTLAYRKITTTGEAVIASTVEDCSNFWNWTYSKEWIYWE